MPRPNEGIVPPTKAELREIGRLYHFELTDEEVDAYAQVIEDTMPAYQRIAELPEPRPEVKYPRTSGWEPKPEENPLNGWYWRCSIKGAPGGKLAGKTVAIKDNISVAGVPFTNGSAVWQGYIPDNDATVVTRILDAGGEIAGKAVCQDMCLSGGAGTSFPQPVLNPHNHAYSAGGSSSGSAALVVNGECDLALGADQGGSIRIPASLCGAVGLKQTYGLVPYTGCGALENSVDIVGPIGRTVADVALLLEAIAGADPLDPRQRYPVPTEAYTKSLTGDVRGLRIGVVRESFGWHESSKQTDAAVREAANAFTKLGATVKEISIPIHRDCINIFTAVLVDGIFVQVILLNGAAWGTKGHYDTRAMQFLGRSRRVKGQNLGVTSKLVTLIGHHMLERYQGYFYGRAQNQVRMLNDTYNHALGEVDILAMPTAAPYGKAQPLVANPTIPEVVEGGFRHHWNTCAFNMTGHPSLTVPCAKVDGLPVGLLLTGRHWEDSTVLRAGHAFESLGLYKK